MKKDINLKEETREELIEVKNESGFLMSCETFRGERQDFVPWHWHLPLEIFYIEKGSLLYGLSEDNYIVFNEYEAGILNSDVLHMTKTYKKDVTVQRVMLCPLSFLSNPESTIYQKYVLPLVSANIDILHFDENDEITGLIKRLFNTEKDECGYEIMIHELLMRIILIIHKRNIIKDCSNLEKTKTSKLKEALFFIYSNYQHDISVKDIALSCHISERQLYRLFQDDLAITPLSYLINWRLDQAQNMLVHTDKSITEICFDCGFKNLSYFGKTFKETTGYTPKAYRMRWQNNDIK